MSDIWMYILLPVVSAMACFYLLKRLFNKKANIESLLLFFNLALMNVVQLLGYMVWPYSPSIAELFADAYLITAYFFFTHLILFASSLSGISVNNQYRRLLYVFPGILTLFHFSGLMVESYRIEGSALLHNDGVLAWCFDLFILVACLATASTLWQNMRHHFNDRVIASKNIIALISFVPLIVVFCIIVLLSRTPYAVPVVVIGPLITLYTAIAFYYLQRDRVVDISVGIGFFIDRLRLANRLLEMKNTKTEVKTYTKAIEKQFIIEALEVHKGNIQETADYLGMNHTTLRNKIKEYEVMQEVKNRGVTVG